MGERVYNVLFLCTGNSARSILAECVLARLSRGRFRAFSAGSHPKDAPHPLAIELLRELGYETSGLRSKSWDEFAQEDSPPLDVVVTVCDAARGEACPVWQGVPITVHWGLPDPAAVTGGADEQRRVFREVYAELERRIERLTRLPVEELDRTALQRELDEIGGRSADAPES